MLNHLILVFCFGVLAASAAKAKTDCEEHRERESKSSAPLPMRLIPECDSNGDYKPLQCFKDSKFCACWDKEGYPVTQPSGKYKACDCVVQKHEVEKKKLMGAYKPQCEEDGTFKKYQCRGSTGSCWCAHPKTGEKTKEKATAQTECK